MKAVILAGGKGTRLKGIINDLPKPMALVGDRPFLEYLISQLVKWQIKEIILSIGYKKDTIKSYFGNGKQWDVDIIYSEENEPLGTGGAIKKTTEIINAECFIVMNGDSFLDINFDHLISFHNRKCARATIGLACVDNTSRFGKVEINERNEVTGFVEKGIGNRGLINGGVYLFNRSIFRDMPDGKVSLENDFIHTLVHHGLYGMKVKGFFVDIGIPQAYVSLCQNSDRLKDGVGSLF